jgi:hypothetical protein
VSFPYRKAAKIEEGIYFMFAAEMMANLKINPIQTQYFPNL